MTEKELLQLKEKIDSAKIEVAELNGQKKRTLQQLKDDWNCKTVEDANALLEKLKDEIEQIDIGIQNGILELQEKYDGLFTAEA